MPPITTRYDTTAGAREDVLDAIMQLSPEETPLLSRLPVSQARSAFHSWLTDTLNSGTATGGATPEGATAQARETNDRSRPLNYTQITTYTIDISGTQEATSMYGMDSEYTYQLEKGMKIFKLMQDQILWNSTSASGSGTGSARSLTGIIDVTRTNRVTGSGQSCGLTETLFNNLIQSIAETGGGVPNIVFAKGWNKRRISQFATANTRTLQVGDSGKISNRVDVYDSDFGTLEIIFERYIPGSVVAVMDMKSWAVAYLRRPFILPLATIGDSKRAEIIGEYTLEYKAEPHNGLCSAFTTSGT